MEVHRSIKHRSLGIDPPPPILQLKRPLLGERHRSAPLVPQTRRRAAASTRRSSVSRQIIVDSGSEYEEDISSRRKTYPTINLAVLGKARVGKSTFIRNALDLGRQDALPGAPTKVLLDDSPLWLRLHEMGPGDIEMSGDQSLRWSKVMEDGSSPSIDAVVILYDVTNESSVVGLSRVLHTFCKSRPPVLLIACKSDAPISEQEVGIAFIERMRSSYPWVVFGESSSNHPGTIKKCLITALKAVIVDCDLDNSTTASVDEDEHKSEARVLQLNSADFQPTFTMPTGFSGTVAETEKPIKQLTRSDDLRKEALLNSPDTHIPQTTSQLGAQGKNNDNTASLILHREEFDSQSEDHDQIEPETYLKSPTLDKTDANANTGGGTPFPELVDRLLRLPANKSETKFVPAFLCLYRSFATPRRLLVEIIDRFVLTDESDLVSLTKMAELLRYLQVLAQWTGYYPGDFAGSSTRRLLLTFARGLEQNKHFAPTARDIIGNLLTIIMDDDHDWAYNDAEDQDKLLPRKPVAATFTLGRSDSHHEGESDISEDDKDVRRRSIRNSGSGSTNSSIVRSSVTSSQSATNLFNLDNAREQSKLLKTVPHISLSKIQWHQFMSIPIEELAREITRMDWIMYSGIRARDFVRHVMLPRKRRMRLRHADTIGLMVRHFNHLALFVSGMILVREKPKHRARILEKFMELAWKVRQLNNYNSLGAIVAGITGPEISRLGNTHELVPAEAQKQFMRLTVLMSTSKSYAAYRMAWENSFSERIPFIPLIRQDLTYAANANPTFIGKNVNWRKFEIMGDVIVSIQRSRDQPYSFPDRTTKSQETTKLILETKVIDEPEDCADPRSELYDRSVRLESYANNDTRKSVASASGFGVKRTMTGWFQS